MEVIRHPIAPEDRGYSGLRTELLRELPRGHVLNGQSFTIVAVFGDNVLLSLSDGRAAIVHLTWSGREEPVTNHPWTTLYESIDKARAAPWDEWG